jgi:hypothetical protein
MLPNIFTTTHTTKKGKKEKTLRWWVTALMALALALGTWNPTGHHFVNYVTTEDITAGFAPFGIILMLGAWFMALKSIFQSLKIVGAFFVTLGIAAFIWGLNQYGLIDFNNLKQMGWAGTLAVAFLIWAGLNASVLWKTLTGVYTTDGSDEH